MHAKKEKNSILLLARASLMLLAFIFSLAISLQAHTTQAGAITKIINFQGKLTKTDGTNVADGTYSMQFKLYDALTAGNLLWTETWDGTAGTTQVTLTNGVFSV